MVSAAQRFCTPCHGVGGGGGGPVTSRGVPPPPSLLTDQIRSMPEGEMFHLLTFGKGNMASYRGQIDQTDRWKVVGYVGTLAESQTR